MPYCAWCTAWHRVSIREMLGDAAFHLKAGQHLLRLNTGLPPTCSPPCPSPVDVLSASSAQLYLSVFGSFCGQLCTWWCGLLTLMLLLTTGTRMMSLLPEAFALVPRADT